MARHHCGMSKSDAPNKSIYLKKGTVCIVYDHGLRNPHVFVKVRRKVCIRRTYMPPAEKRGGIVKGLGHRNEN